jgi:p-hydroxybenzoate 3-monooxygenase
VHDLDSPHPLIRFGKYDNATEITCDFIAGCDGSHGVCHPSIPTGALATYEREYPFAWLGILVEAEPSSDELIYAWHERGFALHSMRSPSITRLYLQCVPDDDIANWPDEKIWDELDIRLSNGRGVTLNRGPILQRGITPMRSFVVEPMQHHNIFLAGDAAHIVPPTARKASILPSPMFAFWRERLASTTNSDKSELLDRYSVICLRRVCKVQRFSWWTTSMLHRFPDANAFDRHRQLAELDYLASSKAASTSLAENYVGLPLEFD